MKKFYLLSLLTLLCSQVSWATEINSKRVLLLKDAYIYEGSNSGLDDDEIAAANWFHTNYVGKDEGDGTNRSKGIIVTVNELANGTYTLNAGVTEVVWVHIDGMYTSDVSTALGYSTLSSGAVTALSNYVKAGGNLYLTSYATPLVASIGRVSEGQRPNLVNDGRDNTKGINPKIGFNYKLFNHSNHAIFSDLTSLSTFSGTWYPLISGDNEHTGLIWDFGTIFPGKNGDDPYRLVDFEILTNSIVSGTWEHVGDYALAGLIEFLPVDIWKGRIIANGMGGYEWNQNVGTNTYQTNIEKLTSNTLDYLCTEKIRKVAYMLPNDNNETVDGDDEATALKWFKDEIVNSGKGVLLHPKDLADLDPTEYTTVWVHIDRDADAAHIGNWGDIDDENYRILLTRYVKNGGNLLLTKHAVQLVGNYSGVGLSRCGINPSVEDGRAQGESVVGLKDNEDMWVINTVIGAGFVSEGNYIRYLEPEGGIYEQQPWSGSYLISDNRNNRLYFNMKTISDEYPIATTGGTTKYEVLNILGPGVKEDHNVIWKFDEINNTFQSNNDYISEFQSSNNCNVLGQWGHKTAADNAVIVQFNETGSWNENAWEGKILCIGLGAYEWQPSNADGSARSGENPYLNNIKQLTYNALNILDNPDVEDTYVDYTYGGVTYELHTRGVLHYAIIKSADNSLQVYDLTQENGQINAGQITTGGITYNITNIAASAFTGCTNLAYADLMAFQGVVPAGIRASFPVHTLIYLPREEVTTIDNCAVKGHNVVNTIWNSDRSASIKISEALDVYDNTAGSGDNSTGWVYYWWANKYPFTANAVSFTRSFTANQKSTVALPFAISASEASAFGSFYRFDRIVDGTKAKFYNTSGTEAYKPYMIVPKGGTISISAEKYIATLDGNPTFSDGRYSLSTTCPVKYFTDDDVTANSRGANFIAEYREQTFSGAEGQGIYAYRDGTYQTTSGTIYADPYRGYVQLTTPVSGARVLQILFEDEEVTGITNLETVNADKDSYYTLSGVKVANPTRGIYVKNGKKVIVK